ncbi:MAG: acyltransferase [Rickettsiaceae bacterium]|nr:MAG: acyltransferase [Rickettsiaceae bacterium]
MHSNLVATEKNTTQNPKSSAMITTNTNDSPHRSFGLDLARTVAISLVLISHFGHNSLDALGFWGVELFFALSGFLIGQILWRNFSRTDNWSKDQILNFWQRRWWRTLPNYYLFFIVLLIITFLNNESIPSLKTLFKFIWFGQSLLNRDWGFYSVSWSLCIEEWFYLIFPLLLLLFSTLVHNRRVSFILSLIAICLGSIVIRNILANQHPTADLRSITFARLDAIAYGVLTSFIVVVYKTTSKQKVVALIIGILFQTCSVAYVILAGLTHIITSKIFLIAVPLGFALIIPYFSLIESPKNNNFISTIIEKISLWSYSIYLSHAPIMWLFYSLLKNYRNNFYGNLFSKIISLAITLIASAILYNFFEIPFTKKRPKELR